MFPQPGLTKQWTYEEFNKEWRGIRDATVHLTTDASAGEPSWTEGPVPIPYMNCRHHATTLLCGLTQGWADAADALCRACG